jgi:hypothetical protein
MDVEAIPRAAEQARTRVNEEVIAPLYEWMKAYDHAAVSTPRHDYVLVGVADTKFMFILHVSDVDKRHWQGRDHTLLPAAPNSGIHAAM